MERFGLWTGHNLRLIQLVEGTGDGRRYTFQFERRSRLTGRWLPTKTKDMRSLADFLVVNMTKGIVRV